MILPSVTITVDRRMAAYIVSVTMPKRTKPVKRDEIRCCWDIETMPASSMRKNRDGDLEPIAELWAPLLRELNLENEEWVSKGLSGLYEPITVPAPYRKWRCRRCGQLFYNAARGPKRNGGEPLYCSDQCMRAVRSAAMAPVVKAKSAARAKARAGRKCATCGKAIKARRSTMRFCSVRCRVAKHRAEAD